uniref:GNAT family N-acetyltransferase n=1 Tax=Pseudomonas phage HRDY3 TaxID=3236930 RepID=A0AB39CDV0_9VIRU
MELLIALATTGLVLKHGKMTEIKVGHSSIWYTFNDGEFRSDGKSFVDLKTLKTPADKRGSGAGRAAMEHFLKMVDKAGIEVRLEAAPMDAQTKAAKLVKFYKTFGFVSKGRGANGETLMIRKPQ